jgi:DNA-binding XRE family transcriptional regulator
MSEHVKAKRWRESLGLSHEQLGERIGYSREAIYWFERGMTPPRNYVNKLKKGRAIDPFVWRRYKMACAGYAAGRTFNWK